MRFVLSVIAGLEAELHPASLQEKSAMLETIGMCEEFLLHVCARTNLVDDAAILEDQHRGNSSDAESCPQGFVLVDVDLGDLGI